MERGVEYDVDQMARARGVDAAMLLTELTALELEGRVRRVSGGRFVRAA
jgi:predicted Rossmann fold nucleotide-binding protein DprA/Smf involved in DNA uptake